MRRVFGIVAVLVAIAAFISPVAAQACGGGMMYSPVPTRLSVGMKAMMTYTASGDPVVVRQAAGLAGDYLGQLYNGTQVEVLAGPVQIDDLNWWQIRTADGKISGWSAEGSDGEYWISPAA